MAHNRTQLPTLALFLLVTGCQGESVTYVKDDTPSCVRAICESTMSTVITETAANADFSTGLTRPDNGETPAIWSLVMDQSQQELADRTQWLKSWLPTTPTIQVPLVFTLNQSSRFDYDNTTDTYGFYVKQTSVASAGGIHFEIPGLVAGRKITGAIAYWQNNNTTTLPSAMPKLSIISQPLVGENFPTWTGTVVGTATDSTASVPAYKLSHAITISGLTETISATKKYHLLFEGETSTNSTTGGGLGALAITLAL